MTGQQVDFRGVSLVSLFLVAVGVGLGAVISVSVFGPGDSLSATGPAASFDADQLGTVVAVTQEATSTTDAPGGEMSGAPFLTPHTAISGGERNTMRPGTAVDATAVTVAAAAPANQTFSDDNSGVGEPAHPGGGGVVDHDNDSDMVPIESGDDEEEAEPAGSYILILGGIFFTLGIGLIYRGIQQYHDYVLHRDTPAGRASSAALGQAKLTGTVQAVDGTVIEPQSYDADVRFEYDYIPARANNEVRRPDGEQSGFVAGPFYLEDDEQVLVADPVNAFVVTEGEIPSITDRVLGLLIPGYGPSTEYEPVQIPVGSEVTVFGQLVSCDDPPWPVDDADVILERDETTGRFIISIGGGLDLAAKFRSDSFWTIIGGMVLSALGLAGLGVFATL